MMLTTDIAFKVDPVYSKYAKEFAENLTILNETFAQVWYELVTKDMGPVTRCLGPYVAPAQDFQYPLPQGKFTAKLTNVQADLKAIVQESVNNRGVLIKFAWKCASTFRYTDYLGGCNGARIRFSPGKDWISNQGLVDEGMSLLEPVKNKYGDSMSWADLIVLAGNIAAIEAGAPKSLAFCPGRADATDGLGWEKLSFINAEDPVNVVAVVDRFELQGLTPQEFVALSPLIAQPTSELGIAQLMNFVSSTSNSDVTATAVRVVPDLRYWADYYIGSGDDVLATDFSKAWTKVMTSDRFDGPTGNVCFKSEGKMSKTSSPHPETPTLPAKSEKKGGKTRRGGRYLVKKGVRGQ